MKVAILVAGPLRGRALGRVLLARRQACVDRGHEVLVAVPSTARAVDLEWLAGCGVRALAVSARDVCLELLSGQPRRVTDAAAALVLHGAHDPMLECARLFHPRPVVHEWPAIPLPGRGAPDRDERARAIADAGAQELRQARDARDARATWRATQVVCESTAPSGPGPVLVTVGRPSEHKRLPTIVEALARVRRVHPAVRLLVAGDVEDPEADAARQDALAWGRALGVSDRVEFAGHVSEARLQELAGAAAALVFAGSASGRWLAANEARARGRPVVAIREPDGGDALAQQLLDCLAGKPWNDVAPSDRASDDAAVIDALLSPRSAPSEHPSLVPLLSHLEGQSVTYADALSWPIIGPALSWLRWKVMRHLHKFFARELEQRTLALMKLSARELRVLEADLSLLEARVRPDAEPYRQARHARDTEA